MFVKIAGTMFTVRKAFVQTVRKVLKKMKDKEETSLTKSGTFLFLIAIIGFLLFLIIDMGRRLQIAMEAKSEIIEKCVDKGFCEYKLNRKTGEIKLTWIK